MTRKASHKVLRVCNEYWHTSDVFKNFDVEEIIMGMMSQVAEREDMSITPDLMGELVDKSIPLDLIGA